MKLQLVTTPAKEERLLRKLFDLPGPIGFDTESVGGKRRYSRAVNDPFLNLQVSSLQGFSVAFPDQECFYVPVRHRKQNSSLRAAHTMLRRIGDLEEVWAHNVKHDVQVLLNEGIECAGWRWCDSMLLHWLIEPDAPHGLKGLAKRYLERESPEYSQTIDKTGAEVMEYACLDALNALELGQALRKKTVGALNQWHVEVESKYAVVLAMMERIGVGVDVKTLEETLGNAVHSDIDSLMASWECTFPDISPTSSKQLQTLFEEGTWMPAGATANGMFKTDKVAMAYQLKHANEAGQRAAQLRLDIQQAAKVRETYVGGIIEETLQWPDRKVHPTWHQMGTNTGRLSCSDINLQNQLARGKYAELLKQCYVPDPGYMFTSADYSQIELRIFAGMAGGKLLAAYKEGRDLHQEMADVLGEERQVGKTFNFGFLIYGGGHMKASRTFGWHPNDAREKLSAAAKLYPEAGKLRERIIDVVAKRQPIPYVRTKAGRVRHVPELDPKGWELRDPVAYAAAVQYCVKKYGMGDATVEQLRRAIYSRGARIAVNTIIQGTAADVVKIAAVDYTARSATTTGGKIVAIVHDEILTQCPSDTLADNEENLRNAMVNAGKKLNIPIELPAVPKSGTTWGEVH